MRLLLRFLLLPALCSTLCTGDKLRRVTMEDIVYRLRQDGIPVCFERFPNKKEDGITIKQQIALIEAIPEDQRTKQERDRLDDCKKVLNMPGVTPETIANWRQKQFDFDFPDTPVKTAAVLDAAVKADPGYAWKEIDGKDVLFPKEHSFNRPVVSFKVENVVFADLMRKMQDEITTPAKLGYTEAFTGPGKPWWYTLKDHEYTLSLKNTDTRTALTIIANRLGPNVAWTVLGGDWGGNLSFNPVTAGAPRF